MATQSKGFPAILAGIRAAEDPYAVLGLPPDATPLQIKGAHRSLAGLLHPDRMHHFTAQEVAEVEQAMAKVNVAYNTLTDTKAKVKADAKLAPKVKCSSCGGKGKVSAMKGFKKTTQLCPQCGGSGKA